MSPRARAVRVSVLSAALAVLGAGGAGAAEWQEWELTFAVRVTSPNGKPVSVRLALPASEELQRISDLEVAARGMEPTIVPDGVEAHVRFRGAVKSSRRISATYRVRRKRELLAVPPVAAVELPARELLPYLAATPLFQSRSILVREFLETNVAPSLAGGGTDVMRAVYAATRSRIEHDARGKTLVLDVIRRRRARRIGIERAFATFLRCARVPARLVEGVDLKRKGRHKRVFWTEVWAHDRWWPVSASSGWIGRLPTTWVSIARDGRRVVELEGSAEASYVAQARPIDVPKPRGKQRK